MAKANGGAGLRGYVDPFRIDNPETFRLKLHATDATGGLDKEKAQKIIEKNRKRLAELQEKLYAQDLWSVLVRAFRRWTPPARTRRSSMC